MNDAELGNALRRLPRMTASPRFTSEAIRKIKTPIPDGLKPVLRLALAFMMVLVIAGGVYATSVHRQRQRINALRAEHQRIETELQRVKAVADDAQPVVVLENGDTRVIVEVKQNQQQSNPIYY